MANPCFGIPLDAANPIDADCQALNGRYPGINTYADMLIQASSDDPSINDVLYAGGVQPVCVVYGGPNPPTPFPPYDSLANYEQGSIWVGYSSQLPGWCATVTGPTNAGYVPYSTEVMYAQRGFGFYTGQTAQPSSLTSWPPLVPVTSAGAAPTAASIAAAIAHFTGPLAPESSDSGSAEIKALAVQSPVAGLLEAAQDYFRAANPPSSNGCAPARYVVLVTDGLPTMDLNGYAWPPLGSASGAGYGVTATFNADGSLTTSNTNDQALIDTINVLTQLNTTAKIKTYIIGVGAGVDPTKNPQAAATLTAMAIAGGTGGYFAATSPSDLTNDMQVIVAQILATTQSTASTAVNTTGLHVGALAYLAKFTTSDSFQDWTGDFSAYPINQATGQVDTSSGSAAWSASVQLDAKDWDTGRMIATWDPQAQAGTPFRWNAALAPAGISASTTLGAQLSTFVPDTNGQDVVQFLRGSNAREVRNGGQFRNRTHKLGDIVDSAPLYVGAPAGFSQSASYASFVTSHTHRAPILYVGANDGMLHAFDAGTGSERFAYIPNSVFANLVKLANPYYNEQHLFYVDGSPEAADVQFSDGSWHTVLVGSERAGGRSLFALDITNADTFANENQVAQAALWEFSDANLGLTFSSPQIDNTNAGWLVFAGNGYNSSTETPYLYAINPQSGAVVSKINLCAAVSGVCNNAAPNGLSSVTVINSYGEPTLPNDTLYAGDLQGNLWRVDITNANPANWVVTVIYQAQDSGGNGQPITGPPAVTLNPLYPRTLGTMVYVGTGQLLTVADLATTQTQSVYGIFDPPRGSLPPLGFTGIPTRADLVQQTLTTSTVGGVAVRVENSVKPVQMPTNRGWFVDYNLLAGERIITSPQLENGGGLVVVSYQPNASECTGGGNAWLSVFNYATGGSFPQPELDVNGDGQLSSQDSTASGANPVAMSLGPVYASAATILPAGGNSGPNAPGAYKMTATSNASITSIGDRGATKQRTGWWEVRH